MDKKTEAPENASTMPIIDNSEEPKAPQRGPCLPAVERMTKAGLVKVLALEHLFATLEIGTVDANVRNALTVKDVPQDLVVPAKEKTRWRLKLQYERDLEQNASQDNTVAVMNMATSHDVVAAMDVGRLQETDAVTGRKSHPEQGCYSNR
ncbi:hypothetical protein BGX24_004168 [Mortierella sp. AD032]|nr:hypothetical protein BGX24_004168 [Mortierella sp. AD032]